MGPLEVTTDEIIGLPFKDRTTIVVLKEGQRLHCKLIVKRGTAKIHVKWRPVSAIEMLQTAQGYELSFKNIGMLTTTSIIEQGIDRLINAATEIPQNLFTRPLIPQNLPIPRDSESVQETGGVIGEDLFGALE
jgi:hypothetical protein